MSDEYLKASVRLFFVLIFNVNFDDIYLIAIVY